MGFLAEGFGMKAEGVIVPISVFLNGLAFSIAVSMCNRQEKECRASVQDNYSQDTKWVFDLGCILISNHMIP